MERINYHYQETTVHNVLLPNNIHNITQHFFRRQKVDSRKIVVGERVLCNMEDVLYHLSRHASSLNGCERPTDMGISWLLFTRLEK